MLLEAKFLARSPLKAFDHYRSCEWPAADLAAREKSEEFIIYGEKKHKTSHFMNFLILTCFATCLLFLEVKFCFHLLLQDKL